MTDTTYDYCKIFLKNVDQDAAKDRITSLFGGEFQRHSMQWGELTLEVRPNPDADPTRAAGDDFVYWPTLFELDTEGGAAEADAVQQMIDTAATLIRTFWDDGHPAVAAADFEDELPWNGGIQRLAT